MTVPAEYLETYKKEVIASKGIVVSNHPLASLAGTEILVKGGNAFDAAISTLFALTVVEPTMVSIFGAGFFICRDKKGDIFTIDNYAIAPQAATEDMFEMVEKRDLDSYLFETVGRKNVLGHLSVATPGTLKAWHYIQEKKGNLDLRDVIAPAIRLASEGYRVSELLSSFIKNNVEDIKKYPETAKTYLLKNKPPQPGAVIKNPDYAETLRKVAVKGSDYLYKGELGKKVVDDMMDNGGLITLKDLDSYQITEKPPVKGTYRQDYDVLSIPPGSSGGVHIIQMLNILENFDFTKTQFASTDHVHLFTETLKIAFADRQQYMGDPSQVKIPIDGLISKKYASNRAKEIESKAKIFSFGDPIRYEGKNTTHLSIIDQEGNMIAATQTLFSFFGSKVTTPGTGMLLNNCMGLFDPRPGKANSVAGGKKMLSSMAPTIVLKKNKPFMCLGTPGGTRIFPSVCQAIINVIDFKMSLQQALEAPKVWTMGVPGTPEERLYYEVGLPEETVQGLTERGHELFKVPKLPGGMNGVLMDESGVIHGASCWRSDGTPIGYSGGKTHPKGIVINDQF